MGEGGGRMSGEEDNCSRWGQGHILGVLSALHTYVLPKMIADGAVIIHLPVFIKTSTGD